MHEDFRGLLFIYIFFTLPFRLCLMTLRPFSSFFSPLSVIPAAFRSPRQMRKNRDRPKTQKGSDNVIASFLSLV